MKKLLVTMSDNITWEIPAILVAKARANYYAGRDPNTTYEQELEYTLSEDDELLDWASNNMDWEDVAHAARSRPRPSGPVDYHREWSNAHMEIAE